MSKTTLRLGATIGMVGVALMMGDPVQARAGNAGAPAVTDISSAPRVFARPAPARVNVVRSTPRLNVVRGTPRLNVVRSSRTVSQTQFRKLGGAGGGPKFRKPGPVSGNKLVSPAQLKPGKLQLGPGKTNPVGLKPGNFPVVKLGNKVAPIWKGPKKIWWGGGWKTFIPLSALGVVLVGGTYFYPDGYLGLARPYC